MPAAGGSPSVRRSALLSLLVPGSGHMACGRPGRGAALLATAAALVLLLSWSRLAAAWALVVPFWLAQAGDAAALARGGRRKTGWLLVLAALPVYVVGWSATEVAPAALVTGLPKVRPLFAGLLTPDLLTRAPMEGDSDRVTVFTPCPRPPPEPATLSDAEASLTVRPPCAPLGAPIEVRGAGWAPEGRVVLRWVGPTGERIPLGEERADAAGRFRSEVVVPVASVPQNVRERAPDLPQRQAVEAVAEGETGPWRPSETLRLVVEAMGVTIALGFIATVLGAAGALPLSVLGARNLMGGRRRVRLVYVLARTTMNVLRAIEPLILAVVFVVWVGQGPFAGALALALHSVAALGKLFSEAIEDIDPGPVEAVRATGATWLQTVAYAVLPQVVPPFASFTVYRFDINVRMSTVLGFVGGGGIGFLLQQWIFRSRWSEAATAVLVIALVVMALDFASAAVRARIVAGRPLLRGRARWPAYAALAVFLVWSWRVAEIEPLRLLRQADKARPLVSELASPRLVAYDTVTQTARAAIEIGCPAAGRDEPGPETPLDEIGPWLETGRDCARPGDRIDVTGGGFSPDSPGRLRWRLPDGRTLAAARFRTDAAGALASAAEVRPLVSESARAAGEPASIEAVVTVRLGPPRPSAQVRTTAGLLVETVLMALMATTAGAILALPMGLLAARNVMPHSAPGSALYYGARTVLNVLRAIEPLILAAVFAAWVGYGSPFAGVLALTVVTVANLGKLFSEAVENIEAGPVEAVMATGAGRLQTIAYGILPQVLSPFLSFGIYHWDINVRVSTVIGFVGGGGIGFVLYEWMKRLQWGWASVAILGIVLVVSAMDFVSARVRERFT